MLSLSAFPVVKPGVVSRMVNNEMVIVLPARGQVKVLNEVASQIWKLSDGSRTIQEIIDIIYQEYDIEIVQAQADVLEFIQALIDKEMISLCEQSLSSC